MKLLNIMSDERISDGKKRDGYKKRNRTSNFAAFWMEEESIRKFLNERLTQKYENQ